MMDKNVLKDILSKKETRVYYLEHNFFVWCIYYFSKNFHYPTVAPFHRQRCNDVQSGINMYVEGFRESAKTMYIGLLYDLWCIVYKKKRFICAFSYEGKNASAYLFSIALELQTNQKLIDDYGQLFYSDNQEKKSQKKSINEFITENDIKLKAFSMGMSMRGQLFNARDGLIRPDSVVMDDIDVIDSVRNKDIIEKNYRFIKDEVFGALADYCQIRVLGNVILEDGLNPRIREDYRNNPTRKIHSQWIYDKDGNITRDRFVETDIEADEYNKDIQDPRKKRISLESKRKKLAEISFSQNFLGKPFALGNTLIKRENIKKIDKAPDLDYIEVGIDPAFSEKDKSDEFSITITGFKKVDSVLYRYVLENINLVGEQKTNENMINEIVNIYLTYKPRVFKIEENGGGIVLIKILRDRSQTRGYDLPIEGIKTTKDKFTRLKEFEGAFQRGEIYFIVGKTEGLIEQLLTFDGNPKNTDDRCLVGDTNVKTILGDKKIKDIKIGDYILTPYGFRKVLNSGITGYKNVITKEIKGHTITGTGDHKIVVKGKIYGFLEDINYNTSVSILSFNELLLWKLKKLLISIEKPIILCDEKESIILNITQTQNIGRVLSDCISLYGNFIIKRKYKKATIFIIKIVINLITIFLIWNWLNIVNIFQIIQRKCLRILNIIKNKLNILEKLDHLQKNGTKVMNEENDTQITTKKVYEKQKKKNIFVNFVEKLSLIKDMVVYIVVQLVKKKHIKLIDIVYYAEKNSKHINTQTQSIVVQAVEESEKRELVYNLTVEGTHCYYANGILVRNCDSMIISFANSGVGFYFSVI